MLDRDGFRPNVGIILLNARNQVFWGKRLRTHSWQFPQGGIKHGETPEQAMFRELHEEVGLLHEHVQIVARTRDWLRYEVPDHFIRREARGHYRGQKQIWFLLKMLARDNEMNLRATDHPEFDAWRWNDYWVPLDMVIEFKRGVYEMALTELSRFLPRVNFHNRFLRGVGRPTGRRPFGGDGTDQMMGERPAAQWQFSGDASYSVRAAAPTGSSAPGDAGHEAHEVDADPASLTLNANAETPPKASKPS